MIEDNNTYLLGRKLDLTHTERRILYSIANKSEQSTEELTYLLRAGAKKENVSAHINSINNKAKRISGRKLIIFGQRKYKLNPYM